MYEWMERATCRVERQDPELFHPVGEAGPSLAQIAQARAVCRRCPVARQCLMYSFTERLSSGIFGGMTESERRMLARHWSALAAADEQQAAV